ncbi:MAG: DUF4340 domain-containing protein [Chloroflexota bacterium]|nr:DUF4340 domain-containing protein [Chloroflexota bacterium]
MNIRLTILLIIVLLLFGGTFVGVILTRDPEPRQEQAWLWRVDDNSLVNILVTYEGETIEYQKKEGGVRWFIVEEEQERQVYQDKWSGTPLLLSGPRVNRTLADEMEDPAQYGLDPPITVVRLTERTGRQYEAHLGLETPDGQNQYARLVGSPKLFSVPQIWARVVNRLVFQPPYPRLYDTDIEDRELLNVGKQDVIYFEVTVNGEQVIYGADVDDNWFIIEVDESTGEDREIAIPADVWTDADVLLENPEAIVTVSENLKDPENYGLDPAGTSVWLATEAEKTHEFYIGDVTPDGNYRYAVTSGQGELFTVPAEWADAIEKLVTEPLVSTDEGT